MEIKFKESYRFDTFDSGKGTLTSIRIEFDKITIIGKFDDGSDFIETVESFLQGLQDGLIEVK